jgi:hypothetical protein
VEKSRLSQEEALEQVRWLVTCGIVDFVEISGGNAEQQHSGLHNSFAVKTMSVAPKIKESTRIRESYSFGSLLNSTQLLHRKARINKNLRCLILHLDSRTVLEVGERCSISDLQLINNACPRVAIPSTSHFQGTSKAAPQ